MSRNRIEQHPDEYREDLNPQYAAGQNEGPTWHQTRTAHDVKELHQRWSDLRDDELKQIPILNEGERLEQGAVYFDLRHPERGEVRARGDMSAQPGNWFVPKAQLDYRLWNLITGVGAPERLGHLTDLKDQIPEETPTEEAEELGRAAAR
jgi:hypothetical protein